MLTNAAIPIIGFVAFSGTGKTTLLTQIVGELKARGLRVGVVKHAHHTFEMDTPGKDSYRLREAGATQMMVASRRRWALLADDPHPEADLNELLVHLDQNQLDLILVEGFKYEAFPKIELRRESLGKALLFPDDEDVIAVASDQPEQVRTDLPLLDLNNLRSITEFVLNFTKVTIND